MGKIPNRVLVDGEGGHVYGEPRMSNGDPVRWQQRHDNFRKALLQLEAACDKDAYSDLERAGLVQVFQFTFELAWKTLKDLLFYEGFSVNSPREVIRQAFVSEYLAEADTATLLEALQKRNLLTHTYDEETAEEAEHLIRTHYYPALHRLFDTLQEKRSHG